ncbi:protein translocase subunit SecD [Magnetospirillum aberrantis]|uniref:Protein translocase subunit SecD n=1 Tax=Magnetospirillum aberrantis SpK TaxID=908842 RepID=A0A7C9QT35_9PROT|nr:protein translocase subunit SecD [Magnetospirillum aberrantis]NFV79940.1 protein translocase subunit SecD [Magnetospirillum aberrantis SpK]
MAHFPKWKIILAVVVSLAGFIWSAPNLLPRETTDQMPSWWQPVSLGLDLQGGSYLMLEVDTSYVVREHLNSLVETVRATLRKERVKYAELGLSGKDTVKVRILEAGDREKIRPELRKLDSTAAFDMTEDGTVTWYYDENALRSRINQAVDQSIEIVRRRIDEMGTREPSIQRQGAERIVVQLPGVKDPDRIKELLGKTAKLTFHMVDDTATPDDARAGRLPPGSMLLPSAENERGLPTSYVVKKRVEVGGDLLTDAQATFQDGHPVVSFKFSAAGGKKFGDTTKENVGKALAIVLDGKVISAPRVNEPILGGSGVISGGFNVQQAKDLSMLLRAGALPAPLGVLEERTVGPDLGADSIRAGAIASVVGLVAVVVFMALIYGILGLLADVALVLNLVILLALLSALGATLTLPGIAGIVLTMGMAVDANVLIYERIREESRNGRSLLSAIQAGFERAFGTILDANLTTLAAAALLFSFGTGPIKGFAVTLTLGLLTSMFTAITVTRLMVALWVSVRRPKTLPL